VSKRRLRAELHKTIWRIANDLRKSIDGWDFKSYVLGMLFYRFISENLASCLDEAERKAGRWSQDSVPSRCSGDRCSDLSGLAFRSDSPRCSGRCYLPCIGRDSSGSVSERCLDIRRRG
jgi:hypothetical protein